MAESRNTEALKALLAEQVDRFCSQVEGTLKELPTLRREVQSRRWRAVFFGGTLRSLLASRLADDSARRPRDLDIVVEGADLARLSSAAGANLRRRTRFGGLQIRTSGWDIDLWPLDRTWAFLENEVEAPTFEDLPTTTFLNVEAVAVELVPERSRQRRIYSGDDQFFRAFQTRTVEVNREENPYPELCVVRSLVITSSLGYSLGPRLARYVAKHAERSKPRDIDDIQRGHYGKVVVDGALVAGWIRNVRRLVDERGTSSDDGKPLPLEAWRDVTANQTVAETSATS